RALPRSHDHGSYPQCSSPGSSPIRKEPHQLRAVLISLLSRIPFGCHRATLTTCHPFNYPFSVGSVSCLGRSEAVIFVRNARAKAAVVRALARHFSFGCTQAPRPGSVADTSWTTAGC